MLKRLFTTVAVMIFSLPMLFGTRTAIRSEYKITHSEKWRPAHLKTLWYKYPAISDEPGREADNPWMEFALPVGDGQFGAMVYGGVRRETVQFNDKTLWKGSPTVYGNYVNFGELYIDNLDDADVVTGYVRSLDLETATASVEYSYGGTLFKRHVIASNPARCVVIHMTAQGGRERINQLLTLRDANAAASFYSSDIADATSRALCGGTFEGKLDYVSYKAAFAVASCDGDVTVQDDGVKITGATEVTLILSGETNYDPSQTTYLSNPSEIEPRLTSRMMKAASLSWKTLLRQHLDDYSQLWGRVKMNLEGVRNDVETFQMVKDYNNPDFNRTGTEPAVLMLEQLYFDYGRYFMIASSRGVNLPSNLQGIWCNSQRPPWGCDIHSNINVEMNYWPAEPLNMGDLHMPFLHYIYDNVVNHDQWKQNANDSGQTKGWTIYTENNIFGYHGAFMHNYVIANAWYCWHLWQHYLYTEDKSYLRDTAFPVMKSCCDYWLERLVRERVNNDGTFVAPNEFSAEHGPNEDGTAHAQQLVWSLFKSTLRAVEVLGTDCVSGAFLDDLREKYSRLDKGLATEQYEGRTILREWKYTDLLDGDKNLNHRHMSHLMALYPLDMVTPESSFFQPMVNSLDLRGDASTGWSMGWKVNLWARALDGNHAHRILKTALQHSEVKGTNYHSGGIYYNLFDSHAPFQIDGNFGATAGMTEMLMQSNSGVVHLLPALPEQWKAGTVEGMKAVGNISVCFAWRNGKVSTATLLSATDKTITVKGVDAVKGTFTDQSGRRVKVKRVNSNAVKITLPAHVKICYTDAL